MPKRQTGWTEKKIARYYEEGRGQGELGNYKSWLTIQDVPSIGRAHRGIGWKQSVGIIYYQIMNTTIFAYSIGLIM